jgi:hypothetical protein
MLSNTCYPNSHSIAEELRLTLRIPPGKETDEECMKLDNRF